MQEKIAQKLTNLAHQLTSQGLSLPVLPVRCTEEAEKAQDLFWMAQALAMADVSEQMNEVPVGAVAVWQNQLVGVGWNQPIATHDPTAHAELMALRMAGEVIGNYRLLEVTLYVTLEPCPMCAGGMVHGRIGRLVYGAADAKTGAVDSVFQLLQDKRLNHQVATQSGVLAEACGEKLSAFFRRRRQEKKAEKRAEKHTN